MGEIGVMMSRLQDEGLNLEDLIDEEIRAAGFAELCEKSTKDLMKRTEAIEDSHASLKIWLDTIDVQLKEYSDLVSYVELDDEGVVSTAVKEKSLKKDDEKRTVIVIDDDDDGEDDGDKHENDSNTGKTKGEDSVETCSVSDFGCQTSFDKMQDRGKTSRSRQLARESPTQSIPPTVNSSGLRTSVASPLVTPVVSLPQRPTPDSRSPTVTGAPSKATCTTVSDSKKYGSSSSLMTSPSVSSTAVSSSGKSSGETSPSTLGFRMLKSPTDGQSLPVLSKVSLTPSKPEKVPPQQSRTHGAQNTGSVMSRYRPIAPATDLRIGSGMRTLRPAIATLSPPPMSATSSPPQDVMALSPPQLPMTVSPPPVISCTTVQPSTSTATTVSSCADQVVICTTSALTEPPSFEEGTRVIGKRPNELWYPGEIVKVIKDKYNQVRYKVKYDKGMRGLLSINHIALETNPDPTMLQVGSRVVALRPRDTAEENATWRQNASGVYGKLDVLYAGIVAEIACLENKSRFLVFFDDGFAQYLSVKKLHYVRHTGKNVWEDVAEHSREFIQEYLEEFPERPMVRLKASQWVKTEWRGKWLKAKVMQLDCSLVKMLFQVDNRSEWIYRGSTRIEPLYLELTGKISGAKKSRKRARKLTGRSLSAKMNEPYVDYSITKPCYGVSLYSKTDPKGEQQMQQEQKRLQTLHQQQRQEEQSKASKTALSMASATSASSTVTSSFVDHSKRDHSSSPPPPAETAHGSKTEAGGFYGGQAKPDSKPPSTGNKHSSGGTSSGGTKRGGAIPEQTLRAPTAKGPMKANLQSSHSFVSRVSQSFNTQLGSSRMGGQTPQANSPVSGSTAGPSSIGLQEGPSDSTKSIIQLSTMRKRTNAGLVHKETYPRNGQVEVINLEGDETASSLMVVPSLSCKYDKNKTPTESFFYNPRINPWEAPWLRTDRRDARCAIDKRAQVVKISSQDVNRRKQDVAALIEARLKTQIADPKQDFQAPRMPLISLKTAVRGPHKCNQNCYQRQVIDKKEKAKHNPLAIPLLLDWQRETVHRHPGSKREVYYRSPCGRRLRSMAEVAQYVSITNASNVYIDQFCFDADISCKDGMIHGTGAILEDISRGSEPIPVAVVNLIDGDFPPPIDYINTRMWAEGVNVNLDPGFLACCDCTDNCQDKKKCACVQLSIAASAGIDGKEDENCGYEYRRLMDSVPTGIYECNQNCACSDRCFNRVVQNGLQQRVQVFKTENRGWGLRTMDDIPAGAFVCTYAGQILNEDMANKEGRDFGDEYLAELDHIEVVEKAKEGYESGVSDMEEDDSVIYKTLKGDATSSTTGSFTDFSNSSSSDESSNSSAFSDESYSSGKNSRSGDADSAFGERRELRKRKRTTRRIVKKRRGILAEESLVVDRESKAHSLTNIADEKWCTLVLKRSHDNQASAANFLQQLVQDYNQNQTGTHSSNGPPEDAVMDDTPQMKGSVEDDLDTQSSEFDFDDVSDSFYSSMAKSYRRRVEPDSTTSIAESTVSPSETGEKVASVSDTADIIDLTDDVDEPSGTIAEKESVVDSTESCVKVIKKEQVQSVARDISVEKDDKDSSSIKDPPAAFVSKTTPVKEKKPGDLVPETVSAEEKKLADLVSQNALDKEKKPISLVSHPAPVEEKKHVALVSETKPVEANKPVDPVSQTAPVEEEKQDALVPETKPVEANKPVDPVSQIAPDEEQKQDALVSEPKPVEAKKPVDLFSQTAPVEEEKQVDLVSETVPAERKKLVSVVSKTAPAQEEPVDLLVSQTTSTEEKNAVIAVKTKRSTAAPGVDNTFVSNELKSIAKGDSGTPTKEKLLHSAVEETAAVAEENVADTALKETSEIPCAETERTLVPAKQEAPDTGKETYVDSKEPLKTTSGTLVTKAEEPVDRVEESVVTEANERVLIDKEEASIETAKSENSEDSAMETTTESAITVADAKQPVSSTVPPGQEFVASAEGDEIPKTEGPVVATETEQIEEESTAQVGSNKLTEEVEISKTAAEPSTEERTRDPATFVESTAPVDTSDEPSELRETIKISETGVQSDTHKPFGEGELIEKVESVNASNGDSEDSVPPLLSVEDLSKIAATRKQTIDEEPPTLTKMTPAKQVLSTTTLADMISKLKTRVRQSDAFDKESEPSVGKPSDDTEMVDQDSDLSSPETENIESFPASPASLLSDLSRSEAPSTPASEMDLRSESKPRAPGKGSKAKIKHKHKSSLTHHIPSTALPPSGQDLSRQSSVSVSSKRTSTRSLFEEEHCYVIDAKAYGNCGRYLNHSCSPNLFVQNVFVDTHDLRFPWVAFFAQQNIPAGEELTWDYMYEVGSVQDKILHCFCGSAECRGRLL